MSADDALAGTTPDTTSATLTLNVTNKNEAPTAVALIKALAAIVENTSTASHIKIASISITDDALGTNVLRLTGADAASFEIVDFDLYLKAGVKLDFETKAAYAVAVQLNDAAVGTSLDATSQSFTHNVVNAAPEYVFGTAAADRLLGSSDADRILGGNGNDALFGFAGRDVLTGGRGRDALWGGNDGDVFDFNALDRAGPVASTRDVIRDFTHSKFAALSDRIDLRTIDANGPLGGNAAFKFLKAQGAAFTGVSGQLHWHLINSADNARDKTIIEGDINGDKRADFQIELTGLKHLVATDFVL